VSGLISFDIKQITAAKKVPDVCVAEILANPERTLGFGSSQLCATYLVLISPQYKAYAKINREATAQTLLENPVVQSAAIAELKSLSQQTGSSAGTGGSTNLTAKGLTSQFLSLASEYGALTETTSGQTTTIAGTLAGVPLFLLANGIYQNCPTAVYTAILKNEHCASPKVIHALNQISFSVGVNSKTGAQNTAATVTTPASGSAAVPAVFADSGSTLSVGVVTAKWIALQGKPSSDAVTAAYTQFTQSASPALTRSLASTLQDTEPDAKVTGTFREKTVKSINAVLAGKPKPYSKEVVAQAVQAWKDSAPEFTGFFVGQGDDATQATFFSTVQQFAVAYAKLIAQEQSIGLAMARPAILTFEYDDNRPANQPSNSVFRIIYQAKLGKLTLTANGAASIYDSAPSPAIPGAERLRDVQIAAQADRPFSIKLSSDKKIDLTGSGSFYFQNQTSPSILNVTPGMPVSGVTFTGLPSTATQVFAQKGNIAVGQAKITIGSASNLKVPISVTYSNRTELVTSPVWRGQIGISYDFDSLFGKK
jgi:hypothetical protein